MSDKNGDDDRSYSINMTADKIDSLWNLSEDLSVYDAAALVAGYNPTSVEKYRNQPSFDEDFPHYPIAFKAIKYAINNNRLNASLRYESREYGHTDMMADVEYSEAHYVTARGISKEEDEIFYDGDTQKFFYKPNPDWSLSTITRKALIEWLSSRGVNTGFFFCTDGSSPDYLDPEHSRYAPKLAAAINAWIALEDEATIKGKSPKQALSRWLREHAADFKLSDEEGKPNETGIEECAKVANWQDKGGAPKTPQP